MYKTAIEQLLKQDPFAPEVVFYITGGGSEALPLLMKHGGASEFMLDAQIPYDPQCVIELLGGYRPDKYCSADTSRMLAVCAYERADKLAERQWPLGVGATCKLRKAQYEREGRIHEVHVSVHSDSRTYTHSVTLHKCRTREEEELIAAKLICKAFFSFLDVCSPPPSILMSEMGQVTSQPGIPLKSSKHTRIIPYKQDVAPPTTTDHIPVFPGSFNPAHEGHLRVAKRAAEITNKPVWFEISMNNCSKPTVDWISLNARLASLEQFYGEESVAGVIVTKKPLFVDKLRLFFEPTFVVGGDTMQRIDDMSFYDNRQAYNDAINQFVRENVKFLAFNRQGYKLGPYQHFGLDEIVTVVDDVVDQGESSTEIRNEE